MADEKPTTNARVDEIAALKQQMEQMQKRLEELDAISQESSASGDEAHDGQAELEPEGVEAAADASAASADASEDAREPADGGAEESAEVEPAAPAEPAQPAASTEPVQPAQPAVEPVDYVPYTPPDQTPTMQGAASGASASSSPYETSGQASTQSAGPSSPADQQAYAQSQQPYASYGATYAGQPGQQVPFGQQYQQPQQPYGYAHGYGTQQGGYHQPVARTKDHVAAGLLGIFLGVFGIHKFYLGYNTAGFIMLGVTIIGGLFTLGLASSVVWLIGVIEGVIYLIKNQTEFEQAYVFKKREWF